MAWFFLSRVGAALIALIALLVLTRLLEPADFGLYNIVILSGGIAQQVAFAWIVSSITRFHSTPEFEGRAVAMCFGAAAVSCALVVPGTMIGSLLVPEKFRDIYLLAAAFAFCAALHEVGLAGLRVQRRGPVFAIATLGRPILATTLAAVLLIAGGGYQSAVLAVSAGALAGGTFGVFAAARRSGVALPDRNSLRTFITFGQPLAIVSSTALLFALSTQLLLAGLVGLEAVGYFAAAQTLSMRSITMLMVTMGQTSAASVFGAQDSNGDADAARALEEHFGFLLLVSVPLMAVFIFSSDTIARVFFTPAFSAGVAPFLPLVAGAAFVSGIQAAFLSFAFSMRKQTLLQLGVTLGVLVLHVGLAAALVSVFGVWGAAVATLVTATMSACIYGWYGRAIFRLCALRGSVLRMGAGTAASAPLLLAADRAGPLLLALLLVAAGLVVMLAVLMMLRYASVETILRKARNGPLAR